MALGVISLSGAMLWAGSSSQVQAKSTTKSAPPVAAAIVGNAERGATLYSERCGGCHSIDANRVGPAHRGVVGRRAGIAPGFIYSPALKASRLLFNEVTIDRWLINPQVVVPRARMYFRLGEPQERADVIAYLKTQTLAR